MLSDLDGFFDIATNHCPLNVSPPGNSRRGEAECDAVSPGDSVDPTSLHLPTLDIIEEGLQDKQSRKACSKIPGFGNIPVCSVLRILSPDLIAVNIFGYMCEYICNLRLFFQSA